MRVNAVLGLALLVLAGCEPGGGGANVTVGGTVAVGVSSGSGTSVSYRGGVGPPPGRTPTERQARRDYYRGPRGDHF